MRQTSVTGARAIRDPIDAKARGRWRLYKQKLVADDPACSCALGAPSHADVLLAIANS